jgi:hypothetical protein
MAYEFGYIPNPEATAVFADSMPRRYGAELELLKAADDNSDALNYRALAKCIGMEGQQIPSRNQGSVGSCVGFGTATPADVVAAIDILVRGDNEEFRYQTSADGLYALSRDISNNLGRGDGSYGAAAAKGIRECGVIHQTKYGEIDLTTYSASRAREWATKGVPQVVKDAAKKTPMRATTLLKSIEQAWAAIGNGYAFNMCSDVGWDSQRDSDGACRRSGKWNHSMGVSSRRTVRLRRLLLVHQSWGNDWTGGPYWQDQPLGSFWADWDDIERAILQKDCFVYGGYDGFPRRLLPDWGAGGVL